MYAPKGWNGAAYVSRKWKCVFVLTVKPSAVFKMLQQHECQNIGALENDSEFKYLRKSPLS